MSDREKLQNLKAYEKFTCKKLGEPKRVRAVKEPDGTVFVFGYRKKRYGKRYQTIDEFLYWHSDIHTEKEKTAKLWKTKTKHIANRLEKSGLWPELQIVFRNLQTMQYEDWEKLSEYRWDNQTDISTDPQFPIWKNQYPFLFVTDKNGIISLDTKYFHDYCRAVTKPMYFGYNNKHYKEEIKQHLFHKNEYQIFRLPVGYDVSFEYHPKEKKAWYSEEYKGCGNGHYYIALDHSTALHIEDD